MADETIHCHTPRWFRWSSYCKMAVTNRSNLDSNPRAGSSPVGQKEKWVLGRGVHLLQRRAEQPAPYRTVFQTSNETLGGILTAFNGFGQVPPILYFNRQSSPILALWTQKSTRISQPSQIPWLPLMVCFNRVRTPQRGQTWGVREWFLPLHRYLAGVRSYERQTRENERGL